MNTAIPDYLPPIDHFLKGMNTPLWLNFFRVLLLSGFVAALVIYIYYARIKPTIARKRNLAERKRW